MTGWGRALVIQGGLALIGGLTSTLTWALDDHGYYWPRWVWFGWAAAICLQLAVRRGLQAPAGRQRGLAVHANVSVLVMAAEAVIWALADGGFFWPLWAILILSAALGIHLLIVRRLPPSREKELAERVDVLTRTRRGALDVQAAELKRVERDLHDGAQARMVSLAMNLGLAEQLTKSDPDAAAALLAEARQSTLTAVEELRTVMRGIQPPVLSDRGLIGAIEALALDLSVPTTVTASLPGRLATPVESAVYLAVAECLANVVKHSRAGTA